MCAQGLAEGTIDALHLQAIPHLLGATGSGGEMPEIALCCVVVESE